MCNYLIEAGAVFDCTSQFHAVEVVNLDAFNCPNSAEFFVWKRIKTEWPCAYVDGFLLAAPLLRLDGRPMRLGDFHGRRGQMTVRR
jgi:hypothetical protein